MNLNQAINQILQYSDQPNEAINMGLIKRCLKRAALLHHPDRNDSHDEMVTINKMKDIILSDPKATKRVLEKILLAHLITQNLHDHPLYKAGVPSWSSMVDLVDSKFVVTDDEMGSLNSRTVKPNKFTFYTDTYLQVSLTPLNGESGSIQIYDTSNFGKTTKAACVNIEYQLADHSNISTWGVLTHLLESVETNSLSEMLLKLTKLSTIDIDKDILRKCTVSTYMESSRRLFSPASMLALPPVKQSEILKALHAKRGPSISLLYRIIATGQFHNFMLSDGNIYGHKVQKQMICNPLFIFEIPELTERLKITECDGKYQLEFWRHKAKYELKLNLDNRYITSSPIKLNLPFL
ncbi:J domain-containing protein [Vibrio lentus]|uniref:J domain-containing protein n=1 Tax=Vibrio splendidus TaxID=29497 RepID=UPI000C851788|nr:J domain-containing protein [Vibrio splendidus]PMG17791.1 hypothetical protein BCU98_00215 [Vibrio splendidus]